MDIGGFIYSYSHSKALRAAEAANITADNAQSCKEVGALTITAPQTFGPFSNEPENPLNLQVKLMLKQLDFVYVRDNISAKYLAEIAPEFCLSSLKIVPDIAFLYEITSIQNGLNLLSKKGINVKNRDSLLVGLTLNRQLYDRIPTYLETMEKIVKFLQNRQAKIILIPHEHGRYGRKEKDDQFLSNYLAKKLKIPTLSRNKIIKYSHDQEIEYIKSIEEAIASLDLLISGRFHGLLRGLSEQVPSLGLSWSHKYETVFESLNMSPQSYIISPDNFSYEQLEYVLENRIDIKKHFAENVPLLKQQVTGFFNEITELAIK